MNGFFEEGEKNRPTPDAIKQPQTYIPRKRHWAFFLQDAAIRKVGGTSGEKEKTERRYRQGREREREDRQERERERKI